MRLHRNWHLTVGTALALILLCLLILPSVMDLPNPHLARRAFIVDGIQIQHYPLAPGQTPEHPLGTDLAGRDFLSRMVHGTRYTLGLALVITLCRLLVALPLGLWVGWRGGWWSTLFAATFGGLGSLPQLFVLFAVLGGLRYVVHRPSDWVVMYVAVVTFVGIPRLAEQVRQAAFQVKALPFVESGIAIGAPTRILLSRYFLRPIANQVGILANAEVAVVLFTCAQLSILGLFAGPVVTMSGTSTAIGSND